MKKQPIKVGRARQSTAKSPSEVDGKKYVMRLFVAGNKAGAREAILRVNELCKTILKGRVKLEVLDIIRRPALAREHQIVACPTLIVEQPLPARVVLGNGTNLNKLFGVLAMDEGASNRWFCENCA